MIKKVAMIAAPLALAGCMSMAPKYERPAAPVAPAFAEAGSPGSEAAVTIGWQRFFADARLRQLIDLALANNRDLRVAILNIEQARAQFQIRRADRLPTLNIGASGSRTPGPDDSVNSSYSAGLLVSSFELDLFGRVKSLSDAALAQFLATEEARRATHVSLVASVANAYLATLADEELLALTQQTLNARQESLKLIQLKFDNGVVSKLDLQQGLSLADSARVTLAQQQRQRAQDMNLLTLLVGQPLPAGLAPGTTLAATSLAELPAGLPSDLLAVRPDIRAAEQQLIAANANIGAARANFFPRISLTGSAGSASNELSGLFKGGSFGWTFAPQMVLPIFDYGRNSANLGSAKAGRDIAWRSTNAPSRQPSAKYRTRWRDRPRSANSCARSVPWPTRKQNASSCRTCATAAARPAIWICWTPSVPCSAHSRPRCRRTCNGCRTRSRCIAYWAAGFKRDQSRARPSRPP